MRAAGQNTTLRNPNTVLGETDDPIVRERTKPSTSQDLQGNNGQPQMPNMEDMMKNGGPGVDGLFANKEMITTMFTMLKSNPAMMKMMVA